MHKSSLQHMRHLVETHLDPACALKIVDLGSYDVNGSYRPLFAKSGWHYRGIDRSSGPNVDIVMPHPYRIPLPRASVDLVVSGQTFEHIEYFWITFLELVRVLRPGGKIFLITPSRGAEHRFPVDCWRFYPDGYHALARFAAIDLLEVSTDWSQNSERESAEWGDTVGVFRVPPLAWPSALARETTRWALQMWAKRIGGSVEGSGA